MRRSGWIVGLVVFLASGAGLLIPGFSDGVDIAIVIVLVGTLAATVLWRLLARVRRLEDLGWRKASDDGRYRGSRKLFYAGLLTSCWLQLRFGGVTLSDALFLMGLALALVERSLVDDERVALLPSGLWIGIGLFTAGGAISTIADSTDKFASTAVIARVLYLIVAWFWLGGVSLRSAEHVWRALKFWVASAAICGAWALGQKYAHLPGNLAQNRYAGLADHVNDLGSLSACALVPALALAYRSRRWVAPLTAIIVGLTLSGSIGAAIAGLVALSFGLLSRDLTNVVAVALLVGAIAIVIASPLIGSSAITRFSTATNPSALYGQDTFYTRIRGYESAWERIKANPLIGMGADAKSSEILDHPTATYYPVHNLFLASWYDSGILGLVGMLILIATIGRLGWQLIWRSPDRYLALALFAGFVAYLGDEMSEPTLYTRYSLVPALLIVGLLATVRRAGQVSNRKEVGYRGATSCPHDRSILVAR